MFVYINFPEEGLTTSCKVEQMEEGCYKLLEHPTFTDSAKYGDLVSAKPKSTNELEFIEVIEPSDYEVCIQLITRYVADSNELEVFKEQLSQQGVFWQQDLGGVFIYCPLKGSDKNAKAQFDEMMESLHDSAA